MIGHRDFFFFRARFTSFGKMLFIYIFHFPGNAGYPSLLLYIRLSDFCTNACFTLECVRVLLFICCCTSGPRRCHAACSEPRPDHVVWCAGVWRSRRWLYTAARISWYSSNCNAQRHQQHSVVARHYRQYRRGLTTN